MPIYLMNLSPCKLHIICPLKILEKSLKFVCLKLYEPCPGTGFKCLARAKSPLQLFLSQEDGRKRNLDKRCRCHRGSKNVHV